MMRSPRTLIAGLLGLTLSATAWANGRPYTPRPVAQVTSSAPTSIQIDNDTGALVDVFVDGAFRGKVRATGEQLFPVRPGNRQVTVKLPNGTVAFSSSVQLRPMQTTALEIDPPVATLLLNNDGRAPIFVTLDGHASFWMLPNRTRSIQVAPGVTVVKTAVFGQQGLKTVETHRVVAKMASSHSVRVGWTPPPPASQLTIKNLDRHTVRIYVAGDEIASLRPGVSKTLEVRPGMHWVTMVSNRDGILYNNQVSFTNDQVRTVRIENGRSQDLGQSPRIPPTRPTLAAR